MSDAVACELGGGNGRADPRCCVRRDLSPGAASGVLHVDCINPQFSGVAAARANGIGVLAGETAWRLYARPVVKGRLRAGGHKGSRLPLPIRKKRAGSLEAARTA